jgi:hypothetical protein
MTHGFQQQDTNLGVTLLKSVATQQNGQKAAPTAKKTREPRSLTPRPGH